MADPHAKLRRIRARHDRAAGTLAGIEAERDDEIRALLAAGERVKDVAATAGMSVPRVYQIRDGRR